MIESFNRPRFSPPTSQREPYKGGTFVYIGEVFSTEYGGPVTFCAKPCVAAPHIAAGTPLSPWSTLLPMIFGLFLNNFKFWKRYPKDKNVINNYMLFFGPFLWFHFFWPTFWLHCILYHTYPGGEAPPISKIQNAM